MHAAAINGETETVKVLLDAGSDPDAGDDYSTAFKVGRDLRMPAVEAMIVREKEFSDLLNNNKSYKNCTALHYAVLADSEKTVRVLLERGASPLEVRFPQSAFHPISSFPTLNSILYTVLVTQANILGHKPIDYAVPHSTIEEVLEKAEKEYAEKLKEKEAEERRR